MWYVHILSSELLISTVIIIVGDRQVNNFYKIHVDQIVGGVLKEFHLLIVIFWQ